MFCKYCGQDIPDASEFCPECGRKLKIESEQTAERGPIGAPLALMLIMLCWSTVFAWGRVLLFGERLTIGTLVSTVMLVAGLAVVLGSVSRGKIDPSVYRVSDAAVMACACIVVPWLVDLVGLKFLVPYWGQNSVLVWAYTSRVTSALQLTAFWMAVGVTLLGRARTAPDAPRNRQGWLVYAAPLLCVLLGISFTRPIVYSLNASLEVLAATVQCVGRGSLFIWLWPLAVMKILRALGEDRIGPVGAVASFLGTAIGSALLMSLFLWLMDMGLTGYALANSLAPLFGLLALHIAARYHNRKHMELT